jgi:hypothetical protein
MKPAGANSKPHTSISRAHCVAVLPFALVALISAGLAIAIPLRGQQEGAGPVLTAHEWGTFTAIAGADGQPNNPSSPASRLAAS